jgi:hypothetical protein
MKTLTKKDKFLIQKLKSRYPWLNFDKLTPEFFHSLDKINEKYGAALSELAKK